MSSETKCIKNAPWNKYFVCPCDACMKELIERGKQQAQESQEGIEFLTRPEQYRERLEANIANFWTGFTAKEQARAEGWFITPKPLTQEEMDEMAGTGC